MTTHSRVDSAPREQQKFCPLQISRGSDSHTAGKHFYYYLGGNGGPRAKSVITGVKSTRHMINQQTEAKRGPQPGGKNKSSSILIVHGHCRARSAKAGNKRAAVQG